MSINNQRAILKRKIILKSQAVRIIQGELEDLRFQETALRYRDILAGRIGKRFDPDLSAQLDLLQNLIEKYNGGCPLGRKREASTFSARKFPVEGESIDAQHN